MVNEKNIYMKCEVNSVQNIHYNKALQDGPSLESSSYLNVILRYIGPWDPWTFEPLHSWTLGPLLSSMSSCFLLTPFTSFYILLLFLTFFISYTSWFGMGGGEL